MNVRFTPLAESDLTSIADWIGRDSLEVAQRFVGELKAKALSIRDLPQGYPVVAMRNGQELRRCNYKGYAIIYRVADTVEILRVAHSSQDYFTTLQDP